VFLLNLEVRGAMTNIEQFKKSMSQTENVVWNTNTNLEFLWEFEVNVNVDRMWSYISDTSRFNREIGLAPRTEKEVDGKMIVSTTLIGFKQEWIEEPWMWIQGQTITSERKYIQGVASSVQSVFHLQPLGSNKTKVLIYFGWKPSNWFWSNFLSLTETMLKNKFKRVFGDIEKFVQSNLNVQGIKAYQKPNHKISAQQKNRLDVIKEKILKKNEINAEVLETLCNYILNGDELDLDALKVIRLAYEWNTDYQELLKVCLESSRAGLLNISWNVVCPHCKGSRFSAKNLGEIPTDANCEPCGIDFKSSDAEAVEVVFKVNPSIRQISEVSYCAAEPAKKSHIKTQQIIGPHSVYKIKAPVLQNNYKILVKGHPTNYVFKVSSSAPNRDVRIDLNTSSNELNFLGQQSYVTFYNNSEKEVVLKVEELSLIDYALRPQQVLMLSEYRDIFAEEHLKSEVKLHLGEQSIIFTDVVGSTAYYEKVGDAKAFDEVRRHFTEVFEVVKKHDGKIVKTIGDAVMASFPNLDNSLLASEEIQKNFNGKREDLNLRLRISIHKGIVIAVHLETGIDYFGSAINKCAKIQGLAGAGQIAMVEEVYSLLTDKLNTYDVTDVNYDSDKMSRMPVKVITIS
jgi:class 3 adenylate cyclase